MNVPMSNLQIGRIAHRAIQRDSKVLEARKVLRDYLAGQTFRPFDPKTPELCAVLDRQLSKATKRVASQMGLKCSVLKKCIDTWMEANT